MKIFNKKIADIGYYINLDSSVDRKINVESQIEKFEISDLHRIPALTDSMIQSSATKSHRKVFELCREQNIESVLVLEDDFQLYENVFLGEERHTKPLIDYLDDLINEMNSVEWDVILLGFNGRKPSIPLSRQFSITFRSTGGWGYIIKKSAYEYILDNFEYYRDRMAIDDILPALNFSGFRTVSTNVQVINHAVGFVSTLNPQGPVDYRQWINGNYYNSIWRHIKHMENFEHGLDEIFNNSKFNRENLIVLKNYPKNYIEIESFISSKNEYRLSLVLLNVDEVSDEEFRSLNYHFSVESSSLVTWSSYLPNVKKYYKNIYEIDLSKNN